MTSEPLAHALKEGLEGVVRSLERLRDDLHRQEMKCATGDVDMRAQLANTRQWIGSIAAIIKGDRGGEPLQQQIAMLRRDVDGLKARKVASDAVDVAKVGAKSKITVQLILTVGTVLASFGALAIALLK